MISSRTRAVWLEVDVPKKETTIADSINNWCSANTNVEIQSIEVYQEHITKYKALIIYMI
jgi:hypothetical protein